MPSSGVFTTNVIVTVPAATTTIFIISGRPSTTSASFSTPGSAASSGLSAKSKAIIGGSVAGGFISFSALVSFVILAWSKRRRARRLHARDDTEAKGDMASGRASTPGAQSSIAPFFPPPPKASVRQPPMATRDGIPIVYTSFNHAASHSPSASRTMINNMRRSGAKSKETDEKPTPYQYGVVGSRSRSASDASGGAGVGSRPHSRQSQMGGIFGRPLGGAGIQFVDPTHPPSAFDFGSSPPHDTSGSGSGSGSHDHSASKEDSTKFDTSSSGFTREHQHRLLHRSRSANSTSHHDHAYDEESEDDSDMDEVIGMVSLPASPVSRTRSDEGHSSPKNPSPSARFMPLSAYTGRNGDDSRPSLPRRSLSTGDYRPTASTRGGRNPVLGGPPPSSFPHSTSPQLPQTSRESQRRGSVPDAFSYKNGPPISSPIRPNPSNKRPSRGDRPSTGDSTVSESSTSDHSGIGDDRRRRKSGSKSNPAPGPLVLRNV